MTDELDLLRDWCIYENKEKIEEYLSGKSDKELFKLLENINDINPSLYELVVQYILNKLYSADEDFIRLLCDLIEKAPYFVSQYIKNLALLHEEKTLAITGKILDMRVGTGLCSGILISPLLGQNLVDKDIVSYLKSDDLFLQRHSLFAIDNFIDIEPEGARFFVEKLVETVDKIDESNIDLLFQVLINAFRIDEKLSLDVIEKEIERLGYSAALAYLRNARSIADLPVFLLQKSVRLVEGKIPEENMIDSALSTIYEKDPAFVVERLQKRLHIGKIPIANDTLGYIISSTDSSPVIRMLEEEIDANNPTIVNFGEYILEQFFSTKEEYLQWCDMWKDDERKSSIIIKSISKILSEKSQSSTTLNKAVSLVRFFADKQGIDYRNETKSISFKKGSTEDVESEESRIKALQVLKKLRAPPNPIDTDGLMENLSNFPFLSKVVEPEWLVETAKSEHPHPLARIYVEKIDYGQIERLFKELESESDRDRKLVLEMQYRHLVNLARMQRYWEEVFKVLDEFNLNLPKKKIIDIDNAESFLTEAEVIARLAPFFKVSIEPNISELGRKRIDAKIEFGGEEALIEIAMVKKSIESEVSYGALVELPGAKVKNVLNNKFEGQLQKGKTDLRTPVIIILRVSDFCLDGVENAIYGEMKLQWKLRTDTHEIISEGWIREDNSFYKEEGTDIVTAIAAYVRDFTKKDPLVGKLYRPLPPTIPRNPTSREFRLRLRDALFGESENSCWQSLLKIEGIDEKTYNMLKEKGIYLIGELLELDKPPEGINLSVWYSIIDDAKRIMNHNCSD